MENVAKKIREGGPGMPAFGTTFKDVGYRGPGHVYQGREVLRGGRESGAESVVSRGDAKVDGAERLVGRRHGSGQDSERRFAGRRWRAADRAERRAHDGVYGRAGHTTNFPRCRPGITSCGFRRRCLFKPYVIYSVHVDGATKLDDIVLERVSDTDGLPATPEIERQLSGAELLWNMPGTAQEKATLQKNCSACHSWKQIFRNRYDEHSWGLIVDRMTQYSGTSLVIRIKGTSIHGRRKQFGHAPRRNLARRSEYAGEISDASPGTRMRKMNRCACSRAREEPTRRSSLPNTSCRSRCWPCMMSKATRKG